MGFESDSVKKESSNKASSLRTSLLRSGFLTATEDRGCVANQNQCVYADFLHSQLRFTQIPTLYYINNEMKERKKKRKDERHHALSSTSISQIITPMRVPSENCIEEQQG